MDNIKTLIKSFVDESVEVKIRVKNTLTEDIIKTVEIISNCFKVGGKILVCGNGGSAADAQHMAGEFVGRFKLERKALPCIALTTDTSILTAWSNDYSYDTIFERQVEALGNKNDLLIGISTSGNSINIIKAVDKAKVLGMRVIILSGRDGGKLKDKSDVNLIVNSHNTPRIQESHIMIIHILCELVDKKLFGQVR